MATVYSLLLPHEADFLSSDFPQMVKNSINLPIFGLAYDGAGSIDEAAFWRVDASLYNTGNLSIKILWYADSGVSGDVVWGASLQALTPDADTQDITTDTLDIETTVTDSHLGVVDRRLHQCTITLGNLDSLSAGDYVTLRIRRLGSDGSDTLDNIDAILVGVVVSYTT